MRRAAGAALLATLAFAPAAHAQDCLTADPPPINRPAQPLRFGVTPGAAGSAGASQGTAAPVDEAKVTESLGALRPPGRELVMRLNRLFWADGDEGIARFAALVDRYARDGYPSEVQIRYHPPEGRAGDMEGWEAFVRAAVRELGRRPSVVAVSVTNEANLPISPNTSDGAYAGVQDAIVRGVPAARAELDALGRRDVPVGFTVMWRWSPDSDARFWTQVGQKATPAFRAALSYVGLQVYPGLVWPPAQLPDRTAGMETVEALTLIRRCYMPKAGLGDGVALWVSENGYATNLGRNAADQAVHLDSTVRDVHRWSGELGVTDYRWFNLRDNDSDGEDLFDAVGLFYDDYRPKPAAAGYRGLIDLFGAPVAAERAEATLRFRARRVGKRRYVVRGTVAPAPCGGVVTVTYKQRRRTVSSRGAHVTPDCRWASSVTFRRAPRRALRLLVRFQGNPNVKPVSAPVRRVR